MAFHVITRIRTPTSSGPRSPATWDDGSCHSTFSVILGVGGIVHLSHSDMCVMTLVVVPICISLMANYVKDTFMCLLVTNMLMCFY